ncbi:FAD-dependent monooxygenase [Actinoplanes sp. TFC3]|uniref:FAD-dependent monooxygenase n=1 Tax=Actinoplanes sp. TFC3 TaxID=1710355 RepID=UPI00082B2BF7|nr:FAD-dependent monooxygenase [Actinoplanes sp. TFC3]
MTPPNTPVLVVGAGVTGCVLALELAHHGVPSIVVERAARAPRHRELTLVSGRSMELLRRLGLTSALRRHGFDPDWPPEIVWARGIGQPPVLVSRSPSVNEVLRTYEKNTDGSDPIEAYLLLPSSDLTSRLRVAARDHPLIDLRQGWTFTDLRADADAVVAVLVDAASGERHMVQATYLAGCDGAHSTVRRCLAVTMEQLAPPVPHCTVYFRSDELAGPPPGPATIITAGLTLTWRHDEHVWIGQLPMSAGEATMADPTALLRGRLGSEPAEILGVAQSEEALRVATAYHRGPVYLAGEAAHHLAPPGGPVDTCIGDAVDLGWKLAAAVHGWGGPDLLASYEHERRQRALIDREMAARALETRRRFGRLAVAGASPEVLAGVLDQEAPQVDLAGAFPGARAPAVRMADGGELFDKLGPQFTLVDQTEAGEGEELVATAEAQGLPIKHLPVRDPLVRDRWAADLVLIRPDQHIAWHSGGSPAGWKHLLDAMTATVHRPDHVNT